MKTKEELIEEAKAELQVEVEVKIKRRIKDILREQYALSNQSDRMEKILSEFDVEKEKEEAYRNCRSPF